MATRPAPPGEADLTDMFVPLPEPAHRLGAPFDTAVPPGGYLWWYVDAISRDGAFGLTLIAFVGSVFSPYYAWSGRRDPEDHCALNIALYGPRARRWAMTERGRGAISRTAECYRIGPSALHWQDGRLIIDVDEIAMPVPGRVRGTITVTPRFWPQTRFALDATRRHIWQPVGPWSDVSVALSHPDLNWCGEGYLDSNWGAEPLESGFQAWDWSRAHHGADCVVYYDSLTRSGARSSLATRLRADGAVLALEPPPRAALATTLWRVPRATRALPGRPPHVHRTLEDTPFYARSMVANTIDGDPVMTMHESLCLDRFSSPLVRMLLPFRMPRLRG